MAAPSASEAASSASAAAPSASVTPPSASAEASAYIESSRDKTSRLCVRSVGRTNGGT
jgi:hypothetical protein